MRTNIDLNDELVREAFSLSKEKTKKDLIHEALREFIKLKKRKDLTELAGKIEFLDKFNHKDTRNLRG
ncbi:MAG: type II toxin-antitoxin system VapB family antitoxin [Proteobacteria bacterium]|nr:type II toxin-antitoxin system VapB family antitoxin [Pseudomonadota bacterium]